MDCCFLLGAHREAARAVLLVGNAVTHGDIGRLDVALRAAEPLSELAVAVAHALDMTLLQISMDRLVAEGGAVGAHGRRGEDDTIRLLARLERGVMLGHALLDGARGEADLQHALELGVAGLLVCVDDGSRLRSLREEVELTHQTRHPDCLSELQLHNAHHQINPTSPEAGHRNKPPYTSQTRE